MADDESTEPDAGAAPPDGWMTRMSFGRAPQAGRMPAGYFGGAVLTIRPGAEPLPPDEEA